MVERPPIVEAVVLQHLEEARELFAARQRLTKAPHVTLQDLHQSDERLAANLDGLGLAGEYGRRLCEEAVADRALGAVFVSTVRALESRDAARLDRLFALAQAIPEARSELLSAFGWIERDALVGLVAALLSAADPFRRTVAVAACGMHRVHPGTSFLRDPAHSRDDVRMSAVRAAGELGCPELLAAAGESADIDTVRWFSWSSVLLGDRGRALERLSEIGVTSAPTRAGTLRLALQAMNPGAGHRVLQRLARDPGRQRLLIAESGIVGDPAYVPWLLGLMSAERTARLAGEAFSLITGADLACLDLESKPPERVESEPNDDPEDSNTDMDPDDGLPWPDPDKVQSWWNADASRFRPGHRYFMGALVTREHCIEVLKTGYQRQRILAAHYLCLLDPGTPLFNTSAPAWRQQRLLAEMK